MSVRTGLRVTRDLHRKQTENKESNLAELVRKACEIMFKTKKEGDK